MFFCTSSIIDQNNSQPPEVLQSWNLFHFTRTATEIYVITLFLKEIVYIYLKPEFCVLMASLIKKPFLNSVDRDQND